MLVRLQRAIETLSRHADASFVEFALDDGAGRYGRIGENDPALVALRASHDVVDLHVIKTAFAGEFAYPMLCRGHLLGALIVGPKRSGEPYAPDESAAIAQVAHGVGVALDLLCIRRADGITEVLDALRALPDAIADRLREQRV